MRLAFAAPIFAVSFAAFAAHAESPRLQPSYDCARASNAVETKICEDFALARLDVEMTALYARSMRAADDAGKAALRAEQREWAASRMTECDGADELGKCLSTLYRDRIAFFYGGLDDIAGSPRLELYRAPNPTVSGKSAEACFGFSDRLWRGYRNDRKAARDAVSVAPDDRYGVNVWGETLCVTGLPLAAESVITIKDGLRAENGGALRGDYVLTARAPDFPPSIRFATRGRILPSGATGAPIETMNLPFVRLSLLRVTDQDVLAAARGGFLNRYFSYHDFGRLVANLGDELWSGVLETGGRRNAKERIAAPITELLGEERKPGLYVALATRPPGARQIEPAVLFFTISDIGLTTFQGEDGLTAVARSAATGAPLADVRLVLRAARGEALGEARTDAKGFATLPAAALRGVDDDAPRLLAAYGADGDFVYLDFKEAAIDLSERGSAGRAAPGPIDVFVTTERGVYRPGESVHLLALMRDDRANALPDLPAIAVVKRPDGLEVFRQSLSDDGGGASTARFDLPPSATTGPWRVDIVIGDDKLPTAVGQFMVEDFAPPRIEVALSLKDDAPEDAVEIAVQGDFLYGAPAAGLSGEATGVVREARTPAPGLNGFLWGRSDRERFETQRLDAIVFTLDDQGAGVASIPVSAPEDVDAPLEASVRVSVFDVGGRPVSRRITGPVPAKPAYIGIRPTDQRAATSWYDRPRADAATAFDLVAIKPGGERIAIDDLTWRIVREEVDYFWWRENGAWRSRRTVADREVVAEGRVALAADAIAQIEPTLDPWAHYRLEASSAALGVSAAYQFWTGWGGGEVAERAPDGLRIELPDGPHSAGDRITVRVTPPYDAMVQLTLAGDRVYGAESKVLSASGGEIELTLPEEPTAGVYILANAFMRPDGERFQAPLRAIGAAWVGYDVEARRLSVDIDAPDQIEPEQSVEITLRGAPAGAKLWLAAVDEGVLQLTDFQSPDPAAHYLAQRALGVQLRDVYGRFIDAGDALRGRLRQGGDAAALSGSANLSNLPKKTKAVTALTSGVLTAGADGVARATFDIPDFEGRLRLMAVGWSNEKIGGGEGALFVRRPVASELATPRFLAPGDEAELTLSLRNVDGPDGAYSWTLATEGPVELDRTAGEKRLARSESFETPVLATATGIGDAAFTLTLDGPDGFAVERRFPITVRSGAGFETRMRVSRVRPGEVLEPALRLVDGLDPSTVSIRYGLNPVPDLQLANHALWLNRYPYGCAEQTTSTTAPLLAAASLREHYDIRFPGPPADAIAKGIARLKGMQGPSGGFGLWRAQDAPEDWVSVYALDMLTQAQEDAAFVDRAEAYVRRIFDVDRVDDSALAVRAYALSVLARRGSADLAEAQRFYDRYFFELTLPFEKAQVGAALAALGDSKRARDAFDAAFNSAAPAFFRRWVDYSSSIRDQAGALAAAAESGVMPWEDLLDEAEILSDMQIERRWLSTQERAWIIRAGEAMRQAADEAVQIEIDDAPVRLIGGAPRFVEASAGGVGPRLRNAGDAPLYGATTVTGTPIGAPRSVSEGFTARRAYYSEDGELLTDLTRLKQNDVLVVLLTVRKTDAGRARSLLVDYLPAGLELENANLGGGGLGDAPWLADFGLTEPRYVELRDDRFVAAIDLNATGARDDDRRIAYLARVVTPGRFTHVGPLIEDMYAPENFGRGSPTDLIISAR